MERALLFFYTETPLHAGGSESIGAIDLPIQRESASRLPTMWGQSAKGALRDHGRERQWQDLDKIFGSPPPTPGSTAPPDPGWLAVGDLRLVAFPVPTLERTFAWVTSPLLLARQKRLATLAGVGDPTPDVPAVAIDHAVPSSARWVPAGDTPRIVVGEYDLLADPPGELVPAWAEWLARNALPEPGQADAFAHFRSKLADDLLLVSDEVLQSLTLECAEVVARIQLKEEEKTVSNLWYSEYLPAETLLTTLLRRCDGNDLSEIRSLLDGNLLVAGGDETVGKGMCWLRWVDGA